MERGRSLLPYALAGLTSLNCGISQASEQDWFRLLKQGKQQEVQGEYMAAYQSFREALRIAKQSRLGPRALAITMNNAGSMAQNLGKYVEAEGYYRRSVANLEASGDEGVNLSAPLYNLAMLYVHTGRWSMAERTHQRALEMRTRALGPRHPDVARVLIGYGLAHHSQGNLEKAELSYREGLAILMEAKSATGADIGAVKTSLAALLVTKGLHHEAARMAAEAVASIEESFGTEHPVLVPALTYQAAAALKMGADGEAAELLQRAVSLARRSLGEEHPRLADALLVQAELLRGQHRKTEAKRLQKQAKTILATHQRQNLLEHTIDFQSLLAAGEK